MKILILREASHEFSKLLESFFFQFLGYVEINIFRYFILEMSKPIHDSNEVWISVISREKDNALMGLGFAGVFIFRLGVMNESLS